jgi:hypothetical protein
MATQRQIEANRRNARKSTGPASVQGKAVSSMNALKTDLYAESKILSWEDSREYEALIEAFYQDRQPANSSERHPRVTAESTREIVVSCCVSLSSSSSRYMCE